MDLHLPITSVNGEPIEDLVRALPPLVRAIDARLEALVRGVPDGRIVLVPCVERALLPIWLDVCDEDDVDPDDVGPIPFLALFITIVDRLVDQVVAALTYNATRAAA